MNTRPHFVRRVAVAAAFSLAASPAAFADAAAGYVTLTASDAAGASSFTSGARWSDGAAPSTAAPKDYMATLTGDNVWLRTPTAASSAFAGRSLTIGDPDNQATGGKLLLVNTSSTTISDLRLAGNALVRFNVVGDTTLAGDAATVLADDAHPAVVTIGRAPNANTWNCPFRGAAGTRVRLKNYNYPATAEATFLTDTGAAAREFAGVLEIGDHVLYRPGHWVRVPSLCFNGEGARFECTFRNPFFERAYGKADGRDIDYKIEVGPAGGAWFVSADERRVRIDWPVVGTGTLTVEGSGGVIAFEGEFSGSPTLVVAESGAVAFTNGVSFAAGGGASVALDGGVLHLSPDATPAPASFTTTGGTIVLYPDAATGATVPLKAAASASLSGTVAVALAGYPGAIPEDGELPFLVVPAETDLSGVSFDWRGVGYGQPVGEIAVSEPQDGYVTISVRLSSAAGPVTNTTGTGSGTVTLFESAAHWSDGQKHHATNYLANAWRVQAKDASYETPDWACAAESVTLVGDTVLMNKQSTRLFFGDLRLYDSVKMQLGGCKPGNVPDERQEISGNVTIATATRGYSGIRFSQGSSVHRWGVVNADLHGTGNLLLGVEGTGAVDWQLRGDNSGFAGSIEVYSSNGTRVGVDAQSATALGGPPPAFLQHGFYLGKNAALNVTNVNVAIPDPTRGVTVSNATVNVGGGLDFAVRSQTLFGGAVSKTGEGTWTLAGPAAPGTDAAMSVAGGVLAFAAEDAAAGLSVEFADGAALGVVASAGGAAAGPLGVVLTNGLAAAGSTLDVRIVSDGAAKDEAFRAAVFTAPAATVDALLPRLSGTASHVASAAVSFSASEAFALGGVSVKTVTASVAPAGLVLVVR